MTPQNIYPLARRLYTHIPAGLRRWAGEPTENKNKYKKRFL
jgi:hypothetical protein